MKPLKLMLYIIATFMLTGSGMSQSINTSTIPIADHHVHVRSVAGTEALIRIMEKVKQQKGVEITDSAGAKKVITLLDSSGIEKAVLLSTAYFFSMPEVEFENEATKVRRENDYVARQAAKYPKRLTAFCGLNPLSAYALKEIERCAEYHSVSGIKLHLANSAVDLRNEEHRKKLGRVFEAADSHGLAIVIHLWTRNPDYGRKDVNLFIDEVLSRAPNIHVQIAHLGGPGTFNEATDRASAAFASAITNDHSSMDKVWFDLAAVPAYPGGAKSKEEQEKIQKTNRKIEQRIRQIGTDRILWGTDWIAGPTERYVKRIKSIPLSTKIMEAIASNSAPYLE